MTSAYFVESFASDLGEIRSDFVQEIVQNGKILENLQNWQYIWKVYHPVLDVW